MERLYRPRWPLLLTLVIGVAVVIAFAYVPGDDTGGEDLPASGGTYVEGVAGAPARVNPLFAPFNDVDRDLTALVFSGLVRLGPGGSVQPDLAEAPTIGPGGREYVFRLRPNLFWHDGERLDSSDVLFTIETIQDPNFEGDPDLADLFRDVEVDAPDAQTVIITLPEAFAPFLARGATVGILPEHLLGDVDPAALFESSFNEQPVGSGPFRLTELTAARAVLRPFLSYHLGRPFLDRLELRFYRDDAALLNALHEEEVDGALLRPGLAADDIALIDGDDSLVRRSLHGTAFSLVHLNAGVELFEDAEVRRALQHALDRATLVGEILAGQALPLDSPIVPDLWAHSGSPEAYAYDPARAASFLEAFGWLLGEDGRAQDDGTPLRFTLATSDDPTQLRVAQELARQWGELGIDVEVQASAASRFVEGVLLPRRFQAALVTVNPGPDPDPYPLWHSTQAIGDGRNLSGFSNAEVDQLLENGRQTSSVAERAEAYRLFQEIYAEELPAVLLYTPSYQYVVTSDLQGLSPGLLPTLGSRFTDVHEWYIETGVVDDEAP